MVFSDTGSTSKPQSGPKAEEKMRLRLYQWFRRDGRDLPWRRTKDPYAILVSEFMLQQTTVAAVVPYYERWMARFPSVRALAEAKEDAVLAMWQGLGYYSRARNLHRAAQAIVIQHDGHVPSSAVILRSLPGIGDYTAAAVASFAFDAVEPVIDANIARVMARWHDWQRPIDDAVGRAFLNESARRFLPATNGALHTSALMDLGALICISRNPRCSVCPVQGACKATDPGKLPLKRAKPLIEHVVEHRAFVLHQGQLWLKLSGGPRWKGMWLLPPASRLERPCIHTETYPITRYRVTMHVYADSPQKDEWQGFALKELPPMPSPHRRVVAAMLRKGHN